MVQRRQLTGGAAPWLAAAWIYLQSSTGLPWWLTVVGTTVVMRTVFGFPFTYYSKSYGARNMTRFQLEELHRIRYYQQSVHANEVRS